MITRAESCSNTKSVQTLVFQSTSPPVTTYHLQRALPGGIVLMELAFQVSGTPILVVYFGAKGSISVHRSQE